MNKKQQLSLLDVLQNYSFKVVDQKEDDIKFESSNGGRGKLAFARLNGVSVLELMYTNEFDDILVGPAEKQRYIGASTFSQFSNAICFFNYTPPNEYSFISRIVCAPTCNEFQIRSALEYLICASIEGFAFLNSRAYYDSAQKQAILNDEIKVNLHSLMPWSYPGLIASI